MSEFDHINQEINCYILLLRAESDVEERQKFLDKLEKLNAESLRLYDAK